jgi:hypothetical protein
MANGLIQIAMLAKANVLIEPDTVLIKRWN